MEDSVPCLFTTDALAITNLVRELVAQSIIPLMERLMATWNDQVFSRRRGISGRFISLSKKWTPFGSSSRSASSSSVPTATNAYDPTTGAYRPDSDQAILRKLGDYAMMLRDFKLAHSVYDLVRADYATDKAWKHHAGANEMTAVCSLMLDSPNPTLTATTIRLAQKPDSAATTLDALLDAATYSYITRSLSPFYALRTLLLAVELLRARSTPSSLLDAARYISRILDLDLVGPIGRALLAERAAACYAARPGLGRSGWASRRRKAAFHCVLAAQAWLAIGKPGQARRCLHRVSVLYRRPAAVDGIKGERKQAGRARGSSSSHTHVQDQGQGQGQSHARRQSTTVRSRAGSTAAERDAVGINALFPLMVKHIAELHDTVAAFTVGPSGVLKRGDDDVEDDLQEDPVGGPEDADGVSAGPGAATYAAADADAVTDEAASTPRHGHGEATAADETAERMRSPTLNLNAGIEGHERVVENQPTVTTARNRNDDNQPSTDLSPSPMDGPSPSPSPAPAKVDIRKHRMSIVGVPTSPVVGFEVNEREAADADTDVGLGGARGGDEAEV
ncbi:hypothetical protein MRB53_037815 [Persea americana]|nr:hypothetical protein MRB53_037815 [Persea americana]